MSQTTQFENDQFWELLTDALRAGPGSPQWHEAITHLRGARAPHAEEYRLLLEARERLESGREYRTVRAGPGFTRRLMDGLEQEVMGKPGGLPSANIIAILAAGVLLAVIIVVGAVLLRGAPQPRTPQDLAGTYLGRAAISTDFSQPHPLAPEWRAFGLSPTYSPRERALRGGYSGEDERDYKGGGIHADIPLASDELFQLEATIKLARVTDRVVIQLFVTDEPMFDGTLTATTPHEFVLYLRGDQLNVAKPDGSIVGAAAISDHAAPLQMKLKLDRQFVLVEADSRQLYLGEHGLSIDRQRWAGVRFLTKGPERALDAATVQSVRILKP